MSELSLLMEYFRLFSSICNKKQAPLYLQEAWEILSLSENCPITYHPILTLLLWKNENKALPSPSPQPASPSLPTYPQESWGWGRGLPLQPLEPRDSR